MPEILIIIAVGLLFAAFAVLHRKAAAPSCSAAEGDDCQACSLKTDCTEHDHARAI